MFNKKLKKELEETKKNLALEEKTNNDLVKRNMELFRKTREQEESIELNNKRFEYLNEKTEKIAQTINKFNEDMTIVNRAKDILNQYFACSILPSSCNHNLELTRAGFILTFYPDNYNRAKFPTMRYSVYKGDYNQIDAHIEIIGNIDNQVIYDMFVKLLSEEEKLERHMFVNDKNIIIYQKRYSFLESKKFIEDVIGKYEKATEQYKKTVLGYTQ